MEHVLLGVLPLGLAAAVSPVMLTEQTVLMAGGGGRRRSWAYAAGAVLVGAAYVGALVTLGRSVSLPTLPRVDGATDVLLGLLLLVIGVAVHRWPRRAPKPRKPPQQATHQRSAVGACAFGAFSMATDVTSLALVAAAAKDVAAAGLGGAGTLLLAVLLVLLLALPAWLPPALAAAAPRPAARVLGAVEGVFRRHSRRIAVVLCVGAGAYLVVRGLLRVVIG